MIAFAVRYYNPRTGRIGLRYLDAGSVSEAACLFLRQSPSYIVVGYPTQVEF